MSEQTDESAQGRALADLSQRIDGLVARLRRSSDEVRAEVKASLMELATGLEGSKVRDLLETAIKGELLEVQWEIEEVLEATAPKKPEPPPPPPTDKATDKATAKPGAKAGEKAAGAPAAEKAKAGGKITAADLNLVFDDPRGIMLHKSKVGERWFLTQPDPRTGAPQTFELHADEVTQIKAQLKGSPYWVVGT